MAENNHGFQIDFSRY